MVATALGCLIGFVCGILNTIPYSKQRPRASSGSLLKLIRVIVRIYVEVFRGTPMVLQAVFIYYGLPYFTDNGRGLLRLCRHLDCAYHLLVSINTGAYMAESVRGGIISIDPGQTEGAKAIGMTHVQTMTSVILPQAIRNIMPQIGNNFIINVKDTSVMFIISFTEFFAVHRSIVGAQSTCTSRRPPSRWSAICTMTLLASLSCCAGWSSGWTASANYELVQADRLTHGRRHLQPSQTEGPRSLDEQTEEYRAVLKESVKNRNVSTRGDR